MARTTAAKVKELMASSLNDSIVTSYIEVANSLVTEKAGAFLGEPRLEQIERWLTAHMIASTIERMGQEEKLGDASIKYTGSTGMGLDSTSYGQMVKVLDTSGEFSNPDKKVAILTAIKSFRT